jgi:hypothetical protein
MCRGLFYYRIIFLEGMRKITTNVNEAADFWVGIGTHDLTDCYHYAAFMQWLLGTWSE